MGRARLRGSPPFCFLSSSIKDNNTRHASQVTCVTRVTSSIEATSSLSPEMSASPSVRHCFSDIGIQSAVMNLFALDLPTPISEKVAVVRPSSTVI